jgi:hypothetical protein
VLWAGTLIISKRVLNTEPATAALRNAMAAVGFIGFLPFVWSVAQLIRSQDEFSRRVHLAALANAFAATAVLIFATDLAQHARLVGYIPLMYIWMSMGVVWWLSIVLPGRYFR